LRACSQVPLLREHLTLSTGAPPRFPGRHLDYVPFLKLG
jgi:hypothetical protein